MSRQINFLAERQKGISKQQVLDQKLMKFAGIILGVIGLSAVAIFGAFFFFSYQIAQIEAQEKETRTQILGRQDSEAAYVIYAKKLATLVTIYKDREDKNRIIDYFSSLFGPNVVITGIDFDQKDKLLHVKIQSNDVFVFHRVLDLLNSDEVKANFPVLSTSDLGRQSDATYEVIISVPITKKAG